MKLLNAPISGLLRCGRVQVLLMTLLMPSSLCALQRCASDRLGMPSGPDQDCEIEVFSCKIRCMIQTDISVAGQGAAAGAIRCRNVLAKAMRHVDHARSPVKLAANSRSGS